MVSCRIFEQDMDIGCIVQCDQTRVEAFKLRVKVDEIEGGTKDKLSGVDVLKQEGYKIPVNYRVLFLVKGENLDFVVVEKINTTRKETNTTGNDTDATGTAEDKNFILMYDTTTGLIVYSMPQSEVCKNKTDTECDLTTTYIYQMSSNRIMIVPKNTPLNETLYIKKPKPQIEFNATELKQLPSLDGLKLRIHGLVESKDIDLKELFLFKDDGMAWMIGMGVGVALIILIGIFALVLYKNWGADDEETPPEKKEEKKKKPSLKPSLNEDLDLQNTTITNEETPTARHLKQKLLSDH
jgi:hypothetical protein